MWFRVSLTLALSAAALHAAAAPNPAPPRFTIHTAAGSNQVGDGGSALAAQLAGAEGVAVDRAGNVYIADSIDHRVRKVNPAGVITTVAGAGRPGFRGDGGPAAEALLDRPYGLALDPAGNLYIADLGNGRVRRISPDGIITTVAGGGQTRGGAGVPEALAAKLTPRNVAVGRDGSLYISDFADHRIFQVTPGGRIMPVAGTGVPGYEEDGALAITARLSGPAGLAFDPAGALYIADSGNGRVRKIENGRISTVLGRERSGPVLSVPTGVALDAWGNLYVADSGDARVRKRLPNGELLTLAVGGAATAAGGARLQHIRDIALDPAGNLFIAGRGQVFRMLANQMLTVFAGTGSFGFSGDGGSALEAHLYYPRAVALDAGGNLYIADQRNRRVRKVSPAGQIGTIAGTGQQGSAGDGGFATLAQLISPAGLAADAHGAIWIADEGAHRLRRVGPEGFITTAAGTGSRGIGGDGGPAAMAQLSSPLGVAIGPDGAAYIADSLNHRLRRLGPDGILRTVAGNGIRGSSSGGAAAAAALDTPSGVAADGAGNVYFSETANHSVRRLTRDGLLETVAGAGAAGFAGDGGPAAAALLNRPAGIAADSRGNLFIADSGNHRIRMVSPDGVIRTIAGAGTPGFSGDGGPALEAELSDPVGVAVDGQGVVYVADSGNHRIRKLVPAPAEAVTPPPPIEAEPEPEPPVPPAIQALAILNAASLMSGAVAPGQLVVVTGAGIGPEKPAAAQPAASGVIGTVLAGVKVLFDGIPAPLLSAEASRVVAQVPYSLAGRPAARVELFHGEAKRGQGEVDIAAAAPALFTLAEGRGPALAYNQDGTRNSEAAPAAAGSVVVLYATGEGALQPAAVEGRPAREPLPAPVLPVRVAVGGLPAETVFAGAAPGAAGVLQLNVRLPSGYVPSGLLPVTLWVGSFQSQPGVTICVR